MNVFKGSVSVISSDHYAKIAKPIYNGTIDQILIRSPYFNFFKLFICIFCERDSHILLIRSKGEIIIIKKNFESCHTNDSFFYIFV